MTVQATYFPSRVVIEAKPELSAQYQAAVARYLHACFHGHHHNDQRIVRAAGEMWMAKARLMDQVQ